MAHPLIESVAQTTENSRSEKEAPLHVVFAIRNSLRGYGIGVLCGDTDCWHSNTLGNLIIDVWKEQTSCIDCENRLIDASHLVRLIQENEIVVLVNAGWVLLHDLPSIIECLHEKKRLQPGGHPIVVLQINNSFLGVKQWASLKRNNWQRSAVLLPNQDIYNYTVAQVDGDQSISKGRFAFVQKYLGTYHPTEDQMDDVSQFSSWSGLTPVLDHDKLPSQIDARPGLFLPPHNNWMGVETDYNGAAIIGLSCERRKVKRPRSIGMFCPSVCCDGECPNIRPKTFPLLAYVRGSSDTGLGVCALESIKCGSFICEIKGGMQTENNHLLRLYGYDINVCGLAGLVAHQCKKGNVNPLCSCEAWYYIDSINERTTYIRFFLVAQRDIRPGEELTWDSCQDGASIILNCPCPTCSTRTTSSK